MPPSMRSGRARSRAGSVYGDRQSVAWSEASLGSISSLLHAADIQSRRSLRMLTNVSRLAELEMERQLRNAEKAALRANQERTFEAIKEEERRRAAEDAAFLEQQRKERAEAAARDEEAVRQAALRKVMAVEERAAQLEKERAYRAKQLAKEAAEKEAKRKAAYDAALAADQARRAAYQARQEAADRIMREKEELKRLENTIKEEEAFLRQEARQAAKERAENELQRRVATYNRKNQNKDISLQTWKKQMQQERKLKAREAKARAQYITMQARAAAEADAARRAQYRSQATAKAVRVEAIQEEREILAERLQRMRHSITRQEQSVRHSLDELRRRGRPFDIPTLALGDTGSVAGDYAASVAMSRASLLTSRSHAAFSTLASMKESPRPASARAGSVRGSIVGVPVAAHTGGKKTKSGEESGKKTRPMSAAAILRAGAAAAAAAPLPTEPPCAAGGLPLGPPPVKGFEAVAAVNYSTIGVTPPDAVGKKEEELRYVLRDEINKETERQAILAGITDSAENHRLALIFAAEREAAKRRILELSAAVHAAASNTTALQARTVAPGEKGEAPLGNTFLTPCVMSPGTPGQKTEPRMPVGASPTASYRKSFGTEPVITAYSIAHA